MSDVFDPFRLSGRVAVLTGAASGIGRASAEVLAAAGASVALGDIDAAGAEKVAKAISGAGGRAVSQRCDVSKRGDLDSLVERGEREFGGVDVMGNIAGIPSDGPLADLSEAEFDRVCGINLKGVLWGCQAAVRAMKKRGGGSIINVASGAIDVPAPGYGMYAITKAGVAQLSQTLANEVGQFGIRVNVLAPGIALTNFTSRHLYNEKGEIDQAKYDAFVTRMQGMSPIGRVGDAIDQAWLIWYLASDASRYCTGQIWRANGGQTIPR
jgi:3-oxoacyl-[acyl-carrier protein] reductase